MIVQPSLPRRVLAKSRIDVARCSRIAPNGHRHVSKKGAQTADIRPYQSG
jgi:hypothetical protein